MGYLGHFWSLAVEEQFYIFFPFLILFIGKKYYLSLFYGMIAIAIAFRVYMVVTFPPEISVWGSYILTPSCLDCFALGGILAYYKIYDPAKLEKLLNRKGSVVIAGLISITLFYLLLYKISIVIPAAFLRLSVGSFCFWVIGASASSNLGPNMKVFLHSRYLVYFGKISYGLYVYHHFMTSYLIN